MAHEAVLDHVQRALALLDRTPPAGTRLLHWRLLEVREATPGKLEWTMDSSALESDDAMRQMPKRSGKDFEAQTLVKAAT